VETQRVFLCLHGLDPHLWIPVMRRAGCNEQNEALLHALIKRVKRKRKVLPSAMDKFERRACM
jgi:hypothetical protein